MEEKIANIKKEYEEISQKILDPGIIKNQDEFAKLSKKHIQLKEITDAGDELEKVKNHIAENKDIAGGKDPELAELAENELEILEKQKKSLGEKLKILLLPKDPADEKNVIVEIRAGAGGDEAGLFAADLLRMYLRLAQNQRWQTEILSQNKSGVGGFKEVIFKIESKDANNPPYAKMKYESGVHRVQRVPETESGGRVHTSTATVAVLPEAEEVDIEIDPKDIKIDVFRSSGPGGQSVNTTDSAVRITHLPTNITVSCQDEKSQHKNKAKALNILRSRLLVKKQEEEDKKRGVARKMQVGSGDRSEKIRTYNFPQDRVTDHRIKHSAHGLEKIMDGEIEPLILAIAKEDQKLKLEKA